ncbi:MAG: glutamate-5-semialdehyde dehydrogenase [Planctomycetota bacterium]
MTDYAEQLARQARAAALKLPLIGSSPRTAAISRLADLLRERATKIVAANAHDVDAATSNGLTDAMVDRLRLTPGRVEKMALAVENIARKSDPVGRTLHGEVRPNGLRLEKRSVPLGVVFFIYESRPNVTADAAALCIRSGNAVILRGGKEAIHSNTAIAECVGDACRDAGLPPHTVQLVERTDRELVADFLQRSDEIDIVIPRGGKSLIEAVVRDARMPVLKHFDGNCHVYIDVSADPAMAEAIAANATTQRVSVCNSAETVLIHADYPAADELLRKLADAGMKVRGDERVRSILPEATAVTDDDWNTEFLSLDCAVGFVDSLDAAISHVNRHGSRHTDAIVTADMAAADRFVNAVDSANVMVNCSTRFSDGGEYGLGAEIGISTDKLHARGPMGASDLCTYKWVVTGHGQVRS